LDRFQKETGSYPSYRTIADHLGLKSISGVTRLMDGLEERGAIRGRIKGKPGAYEIVPEGESRVVLITPDLWPTLLKYAVAEQVNLETAVNQLIRDGLEAA
jgi:SOS-response transcriptional repressor LexA